MNEDIIITLQRIRCSTEVCGNLKIAMGLKLAIYEIERLRNELTERIHMCDMRSEKIIELTAERDEARRMYCKAVADHYEYACNAELDGAGPYTQKDVAKDEGWDCFKEDGK